MADVEYLVADAVGAVLGSDHPKSQDAWADSGDSLARVLAFAEREAPELADLRVEYETLVPRRNMLVHGMYDGHQVSVDGQVIHGATKPDRWKATSAAHPFTQERWSEDDIWGWVVRAEALIGAALDVIEAHRHA